MKGCIIAILLTLLACGLVFGLTCLGGLIFMLLWNAVLPLFGVTTLTFWQAWCLSFLLGIIGSKFTSHYSSRADNRRLLFSIRNLLNTFEQKEKVQVTEEPKEEVKEETKEVPVEFKSEESQEVTPSPKRRPRRRKKKPVES